MRNIPTVTKNLLIINVLAFIACYAFGHDAYGNFKLNEIFGLHFFLANNFHYYQFITYMFMHGGFTHILFNMFALWMFGCVVERVWGSKKFLFYYISCGIGAGLFQEAAQFIQLYVMANDQIPGFSISELPAVAANSSGILNLWTTVGASGAIYAILLAFGMIFPEEKMFIFPLPVPIKAKWFVMGYAAIELFLAFTSSGDGVAHLAHLGGMAFGFFMIRYWNRHPGKYRGQNEQQFFSNLRSKWEQRSNKKYNSNTTTENNSRNTDWEYNAQKKAKQEDIDRILDKIRRSGYDSLTKEEKQKLFDNSNGK